MVPKSWGLITEGSAPTLLLEALELQVSWEYSTLVINSLISEDEAVKIH